MVTVQQARIAQQKEPLFGQRDLRYIREVAGRTLIFRRMAGKLDRRLSRAELQLLTACDAICEVIKGELGEDGTGEPQGDLVLRESPILPAAHQPKLRPTEDAA